MAKTVLSEDEKNQRKKSSWAKLMGSYKTYDDSQGRGSAEEWTKKVQQVVGVSDTGNLSLFGLTALPTTKEELNKIWKKKMFEAHPDRGGDLNTARILNNAYNELKKSYPKNTSKVNFFDPAKAKHIEHEDFSKLWVDPKYINNNFIVEKKLDGSRYLLYLDENSKLLSRRISSVTNQYVDKTDNCPHITKKISSIFWGTVLDGEVTHPTREKSDETTSIMGCDPETAVEKQKIFGWLKYTVYDILKYKGVDLRNQPLSVRKEKLKEFLNELGSLLPIVMNPSYPAQQAEALYNEVVSKGGEGVMLKDLNALYGQGWYKVKKTVTYDVFIVGYKKTKTFTLRFGMYKDGKIVEIGSVPVPPTLNAEIEKNKDAYLMKVMEIKAQEKTKSGSFRHPRFMKFRDDKDASQCIWENE